MLLSLVASALALSVPVRATFTESTVPGEDPAAGAALSATVTLSNPTTGAAWPVSAGELTVNGREASGATRLSFAATPAKSLRTWAVYFVAADGSPLGDPEIVDVLFDAAGNGAVAAREGAGRLAALSVSPGGVARVTVTGEGTRAAYVGLAELAADGARLYTDPDLSVLDATAYAAFQALGLDAMAALDTWRAQLDGTLTVDGLAVATDGTVESGAALRWDLAFHDGRVVRDCPKGGACTVTPVTTGTASYTSPIGAVKRKKTEAPRVALKPADRVFETWDAGFSLTIAGDARDLELAASLDVPAARLASDVVSLDPNALGVAAREDDDDDDTGVIVDIFIDTDCTDCGSPYEFTVPNPANPPAWVAVAQQEIAVTVLDSAGRTIATHTCTVRPTAATQAGTTDVARLVGDCTRDVAGTEVRRLLAEVGPKGTSFWTVELAGEAFTRTSTATTCEKGAACTETATSVLDGAVELSVGGEAFLTRPLAVATTRFDLPFAFAADVDGADAALTVELLDPTRALAWSVADGVVYGKDAGRVVYAIALDDLEVATTGLYSTPRDVVLSSRATVDAVELTAERAIRLRR